MPICVDEMQASVGCHAAYACLEVLMRGAVFVSVQPLATEQRSVVFVYDAADVALDSTLVVFVEAKKHGIKHLVEWCLYTYYII